MSALSQNLTRCAPVLVGVACSGVAAGERLVDGRFDDWTSDVALAGDPSMAGTATGLEAVAFAAESRGTQVFLRVWMVETLTLAAGLWSDGRFFVRVGVASDAAPKTIETLLTWEPRGRALYAGGDLDPRNLIVPSTVDAQFAPTYAWPEYEFLLDVAGLGVSRGETIHLSVTGVPGWHALELDALGTAPVERSPDRPAPGHIRVTAFNVLRTPLYPIASDERLERLVDSVDADIYTFSESGSTTGHAALDMGVRLTQLDPREDGATWTALSSADTVIASPYPMIQFPSGNGDAAAAVDHPDGPLVVFSIHPRCCGFAGSREDLSRVRDSEAIAGTIADLRAGRLGADLLPYANAPVIVAGDYNLVGSRVPLDVLEDAEGPDLRAFELPQLVGPYTATWRDESRIPFFSPGRLDLIAGSRDTLRRRGGFVADTSRLDPAALDALALRADDSLLSDHLMLVADVSVACLGDMTGDGRSDASDLRLSIAGVSGGSTLADVARPDAVIDFLDVLGMVWWAAQGCD